MDFLTTSILWCVEAMFSPSLQVNNGSLYNNVCNSNTVFENVCVKRQSFLKAGWKLYLSWALESQHNFIILNDSPWKKWELLSAKPSESYN